MAVPYTFGSATSSIPLSQLDSNFATTITLGNTAIQLGNTVTTLNNMTMANVTISSGTSNITSNVSTVTGTLPEANGGTGSNYGWNDFKNRIINGAMVIDQRSAGASSTPAVTGAYTYPSVDRFYYLISVASKFSLQQNAGSVTLPAGFTNYLGMTSLAATSVGASDYYIIGQAIEGFNTADLAWGTASAATVTLSFWVRSSLTGTFGGALMNGASNYSYPFTYTISSANTWEQKTITITGPTAGTWIGATNAVSLRVHFGLGMGSTYSGTSGSWSANAYYSATGATSVVGTNGATFYITGVQLEKGSTATSFDYRPYGTELALCQRYFTSFVGTVAYSQYGIAEATSATKVRFPMQCPVVMRAAPTMTTAGSGFVWAVDRTGSSLTSLTLNYATTQIQSISATGTSLTIGQAGTVSAGNFTDTSISFSSEL